MPIFEQPEAGESEDRLATFFGGGECAFGNIWLNYLTHHTAVRLEPLEMRAWECRVGLGIGGLEF
jgi:hypothetical protein